MTETAPKLTRRSRRRNRGKQRYVWEFGRWMERHGSAKGYWAEKGRYVIMYNETWYEAEVRRP